METVVYLCIFYALAALVTHLIERRDSRSGMGVVPPPDRSCERQAARADRLWRNSRRVEKQS